VQGTIAQIGNPLKHSGLVDTKQRSAPTLGGNTQDILSELGYSAEQLSALSKLGAIA
jgi:crotonobetainyl-CoA:carnitine CoA-transferase CaiB-like acyl-CoA transferase